MVGSGRATTAIVGLDVGPLELGPTPIAMFVVLVGVSAIGLLVLVALSQVGGSAVDARWPANEPLSPSEVLWGEAGGHVSKTFPGLDLEVARDLTVYMKSKKLAPGDVLIEAGDLPTSFIMLKSGAAELVDASGVTLKVKPGDSFGAQNIVRRQPHAVTVRATAPSEVMVLEAEDYLAGVALGMRESDDDDYVVRVLGQYLGTEGDEPLPPPDPRPAAARARGSGPALVVSLDDQARPAQPAPPVAGGATHVITSDVAAVDRPAGDATTRSLRAGTNVQVVDSVPGWTRVRAGDGWTGWVADTAVTPR